MQYDGGSHTESLTRVMVRRMEEEEGFQKTLLLWRVE